MTRARAKTTLTSARALLLPALLVASHVTNALAPDAVDAKDV